MSFGWGLSAPHSSMSTKPPACDLTTALYDRTSARITGQHFPGTPNPSSWEIGHPISPMQANGSETLNALATRGRIRDQKGCDSDGRGQSNQRGGGCAIGTGFSKVMVAERPQADRSFLWVDVMLSAPRSSTEPTSNLPDTSLSLSQAACPAASAGEQPSGRRRLGDMHPLPSEGSRGRACRDC